jgi:glycosyltransferase involved in cell wall biosynthesis
LNRVHTAIRLHKIMPQRCTLSSKLTSAREIATITIYPAQGHSHSKPQDHCALAAYTRSLLHALPQSERARHLVLTNRKSNAAFKFDDNDIAIYEVWQKGNLKCFIQIIKAIKLTPSLRVVHLQHEFNQFGGPLSVTLIPLMLFVIRFILKKNTLITFHEVVGKDLLSPLLVKKAVLPMPFFIARFVFKFYYKITACAANIVLVQHQTLMDRLTNEIKINPTKIKILPIGTETEVTIPDRAVSREKFGYKETERVILFFGTIDWRKGIDLLLDAFAMLQESSYRLIIGGGQPVRIKNTPEYQQWYQGISNRIAADKHIKHLGFVADDDIPYLFAASDLVVLPYIVPQMVSAVLNYAASYERPFIGSNAFAGHVDPMALCDTTPQALAEKIEWAFGNINLLSEYSRQYKDNFSWFKSAGLLVNYYNDAGNTTRS